MFHRPGRRLTLALVAAVIGALAVSGVALASGLSKPILKKPGGSVHKGKITFVVRDPGVPNDVRPVYIQIRPKRKLDKYGFLARCIDVDKGCYFTHLQPWRGHPGLWKVTIGDDFAGFFASTPGKYYWQASHVAPLCNAKGCQIVSKIKSFRVTG
jgi:hypothetical protein